MSGNISGPGGVGQQSTTPLPIEQHGKLKENKKVQDGRQPFVQDTLSPDLSGSMGAIKTTEFKRGGELAPENLQASHVSTGVSLKAAGAAVIKPKTSLSAMSPAVAGMVAKVAIGSIPAVQVARTLSKAVDHVMDKSRDPALEQHVLWRMLDRFNQADNAMQKKAQNVMDRWLGSFDDATIEEAQKVLNQD